jgi:hypothetical protein
MKPSAFERCYICDGFVGASGQRDHFPVPRSMGGRLTMVICNACHDIKDRVPLDGWDPSVSFAGLAGLWAKATTKERLVLVKMFHVVSQGVAFKGGGE